MLIRFWCDSVITFSRGLHKNLVTVLYFSIINVLCVAGEDASFAPQANLVIRVVIQIIPSVSILPVLGRVLFRLHYVLTIVNKLLDGLMLCFTQGQ